MSYEAAHYPSGASTDTDVISIVTDMIIFRIDKQNVFISRNGLLLKCYVAKIPTDDSADLLKNTKY